MPVMIFAWPRKVVNYFALANFQGRRQVGFQKISHEPLARAPLKIGMASIARRRTLCQEYCLDGV